MLVAATTGGSGRTPQHRGVLPGAAVYGSFLVASVIGLSFEAGRDARAMTATAFGSMVVFWLVHWWSEVVGAQISAGEAFRRRDALVIARQEWSLVEAALVPTLLLALAWVGAWSRDRRGARDDRSPRSSAGDWWPAAVPAGHGSAQPCSRRSRAGWGSC